LLRRQTRRLAVLTLLVGVTVPLSMAAASAQDDGDGNRTIFNAPVQLGDAPAINVQEGDARNFAPGLNSGIGSNSPEAFIFDNNCPAGNDLRQVNNASPTNRQNTPQTVTVTPTVTPTVAIIPTVTNTASGVGTNFQTNLVTTFSTVTQFTTTFTTTFSTNSNTQFNTNFNTNRQRASQNATTNCPVDLDKG
jgi:hypothetical protein